MSELIVVNKGDVKRKDLKRIQKLVNASRQPDLTEAQAEELEEALLAEIDKLVVAVPATWLPKGVAVHDTDWMLEITPNQLAEIMALFTEVPGKKTV